MRDLKYYVKNSPGLLTTYKWITQFADPIRILHAMRNLAWYFQNWYKYTHLPAAETVRLIDSWPQLHDRTSKIAFDAHYFWMNGWAMRRIVAQQPTQHLDIASDNMFVNLLSAVIPVTFIDYRPLCVHINGLVCQGGDILNLPFADASVESLSCLHVVEHIGLGRYGDPLNPDGTRQACAGLQRLLSPGGNLYFALPVGKPRVCFNAHRVHAPETILEYFDELELVEFSGVHDNGLYVERVNLDVFSNSRYACGMFWFRKTKNG
jgi:hypothetical protein